VEGLDTALIAAIAVSLVVWGLELREMRRYSFGIGCKRGVPGVDVPVDVDGDLAGQGLRSRGRAWTDLPTRSPGPWSPTAARRPSPPQVCCSDAGDPSITPSTRCGSCGSVRSVRIGLESDQGLCGPRDPMRNCLHPLKVATRVRIPLGVPAHEGSRCGVLIAAGGWIVRRRLPASFPEVLPSSTLERNPGGSRLGAVAGRGAGNSGGDHALYGGSAPGRRAAT